MNRRPTDSPLLPRIVLFAAVAVLFAYARGGVA